MKIKKVTLKAIIDITINSEWLHLFIDDIDIGKLYRFRSNDENNIYVMDKSISLLRDFYKTTEKFEIDEFELEYY